MLWKAHALEDETSCGETWMPRNPEAPNMWVKKQHLKGSSNAHCPSWPCGTKRKQPASLSRFLIHKRVTKITWLFQAPVFWGSSLHSRRRLELQVWRISINASDLADGCDSVEANIVYHCLLFCFQSAKAWENSDYARKDEKLKLEEDPYCTVCFFFLCFVFQALLLYPFSLVLSAPSYVCKTIYPWTFPFSHSDIIYSDSSYSIQMAMHNAQYTILSSKVYCGPQDLTLDRLLDTSWNLKLSSWKQNLSIAKIKLSPHTKLFLYPSFQLLLW